MLDDLQGVVNIDDLEKLAKKRMLPTYYDYCAGGAGDESGLRKNRQAFERKQLIPKVLSGVKKIDLTTQVLGSEVASPILAAPVGMQHMAHPDAEVATAKAANRMGFGFCLSTFASKSIEEVALANGNGVRWFQLYLMADRSVTLSLVRRAEAAGFRAIVVTVDVPRVGRRERDVRNRFRRFETGKAAILRDPVFRSLLDHGDKESSVAALTKLDQIFPNPGAVWSDIEWLRTVTHLPIVIKGIMCPEDALKAIAYGASGIVVSNHGGRQSDRFPATIDVLDHVVKAVGDEVEVYLDSGIRRGTDVITALALGARAVLVGRAMLWGLAVGGEEGATLAFELLRQELFLGLSVLGVTTPSQLDSSFLFETYREE
ncbi:alpha-hydroxy acid oxidase [Thermoflavimicrobium daqui]|jgi:isopentenyl diphosphate isomerase/L-lactate dehydrogenase-like FMN-dependent dehydrogenase|uniref:L-lactate oxidase n=1 Tax=Thermoflavimicrobium daqui TaxID=2137476 RepID=A0A364K4P9_9BACL|nr:alpha-hydroxy acid oxidase [Thermoflavimicrobium daqui]RAL24239.1 alpha-hydroxy-acid oxidizing enzyme [Thermoflavimicrobium daqui]